MKSVSKKTLRKSFLNWFFWNGCSQQAETMLGMYTIFEMLDFYRECMGI